MAKRNQLIQSLIEARDIAGISAEYLMTFLKFLKSEREQHLLYSLCCNFHRVEHTLEIELIHLGIDITSRTYQADSFKNSIYVDVDFVDAITTFLKEKELDRIKNRFS
ncbi:hypothetical protein [Aliikangiella maris]|uniref:Uncharacterized protein n=2 Tax=Aliikangiella maris TaxID=3162458 RepID=A0ABV2BQD8_9GAMM